MVLHLLISLVLFSLPALKASVQVSRRGFDPGHGAHLAGLWSRSEAARGDISSRAAFTAGEDPLVKYLFRTHVFRILGRISYSQYLLQARPDTTAPAATPMPCPEDPVSSFLAFYLIPDRRGPWGHNPVPEKQLG